MSKDEIHSLSESQIGYLAGIIDGEGYIGICQTKPNRYLLRVVVTSTSEVLANWIKSTTGLGKINHREMAHRQRQNVFEWRVFGKDAGELLSMLAPLLLVKRAQAIEAICYQNNIALIGDERAMFAKQSSEKLKNLNSKQAHKQNVRKADSD